METTVWWDRNKHAECCAACGNRFTSNNLVYQVLAVTIHKRCIRRYMKAHRKSRPADIGVTSDTHL